MVTKLILKSKYYHKHSSNIFIQIEELEEFEGYLKLTVLWKERKTNKLVFKDVTVLYVLNSSIKDWVSCE